MQKPKKSERSKKRGRKHKKHDEAAPNAKMQKLNSNASRAGGGDADFSKSNCEDLVMPKVTDDSFRVRNIKHFRLSSNTKADLLAVSFYRVS